MNKYVLVGAAAAGLVLGYAIYKSAGKAVEAIGDGLHAINPLNDHNIISEASDSIYRAAGGKTDPANDLFWWLNGGSSLGMMEKDKAEKADQEALLKRIDSINKAAADARDDGEQYGWQI